MNKRVPYTIIPKYLKTINDLDNGSNIKVVYWKLKCEENPSYRGCDCLLYTSPSPRDGLLSRMPSSA